MIENTAKKTITFYEASRKIAIGPLYNYTSFERLKEDVKKGLRFKPYVKPHYKDKIEDQNQVVWKGICRAEFKELLRLCQNENDFQNLLKNLGQLKDLFHRQKLA